MKHSPSGNDGIQQYKKVEAQTSAEFTTPHRLIQMLLAGAIEKVQLAKEHMQQGETVLKGNQISWAISIIDGLRMSLDKDSNNEISENLDALYEYMGRRLLEANMNDSVDTVDEVVGLLMEIKSAWDSVPELLAQENTAAPGQ